MYSVQCPQCHGRPHKCNEMKWQKKKKHTSITNELSKFEMTRPNSTYFNELFWENATGRPHWLRVSFLCENPLIWSKHHQHHHHHRPFFYGIPSINSISFGSFNVSIKFYSNSSRSCLPFVVCMCVRAYVHTYIGTVYVYRLLWVLLSLTPP